MKLKSSIFIFLTLISNNAYAALTIDITGTAGSALVNFTASGSLTITETVVANSTSFGAAPISSTWDTGFDNNLGNFIKSGNLNALNLSLSSNISYQKNSTEFGKVEAFDLGATDTNNGDDFELDMLGTISYPSLVINDVVSLVGSGTFTLSSGTFDTYFETGTYSKSLNGGDFVLNISTVPEPSSTILLGLGSLALLTRRKRI